MAAIRPLPLPPGGSGRGQSNLGQNQNNFPPAMIGEVPSPPPQSLSTVLIWDTVREPALEPEVLSRRPTSMNEWDVRRPGEKWCRPPPPVATASGPNLDQQGFVMSSKSLGPFARIGEKAKQRKRFPSPGFELRFSPRAQSSQILVNPVHAPTQWPQSGGLGAPRPRAPRVEAPGPGSVRHRLRDG